MRRIPKECVLRYIIIDPRQIHFLRFLLEAYEGVGMATTLEPKLGLVQLRIAPGCEEEISRILEAEKESLGLRNISKCVRSIGTYPLHLTSSLLVLNVGYHLKSLQFACKVWANWLRLEPLREYPFGQEPSGWKC